MHSRKITSGDRNNIINDDAEEDTAENNKNKVKTFLFNVKQFVTVSKPNILFNIRWSMVVVSRKTQSLYNINPSDKVALRRSESV